MSLFVTAGMLLEQCDEVDIWESKVEGNTLIHVENFFLWTLLAMLLLAPLTALCGFFKSLYLKAEATAYRQQQQAYRDRDDVRRSQEHGFRGDSL